MSKTEHVESSRNPIKISTSYLLTFCSHIAHTKSVYSQNGILLTKKEIGESDSLPTFRPNFLRSPYGMRAPSVIGRAATGRIVRAQRAQLASPGRGRHREYFQRTNSVEVFRIPFKRHIDKIN